MRRITARTLLVGAVAAVAAVVVALTGTAIAASAGAGTPSAFLDSLAGHLGVSREKLEDAAKAAAVDQVDAMLEDGKITEEQAKELKERITSGDMPVLGFRLGRGFGPGFGGHGGGGHLLGGRLDAAADYLGLAEAKLREQLAAGKSLADVAKAQGKSVDGLEKALVADAKQRLADAVEAGRLTEEQAADLLVRYTERVDDLVEATFEGGHHRFGPGSGMWGNRQGSSSHLERPAWGAPA